MIRKLLLLLVAGLVALVLALALAGWSLRSALDQPLKLESERLIEVVPGDTPGGLLNRLEGEGVLDGAFWLRLYWRFNLPGQALHSGEYRLTPQQSARDLLELWRRGEVVQYSLTLVEGWNFHQVRDLLARQPKLDQTLNGGLDMSNAHRDVPPVEDMLHLPVATHGIPYEVRESKLSIRDYRQQTARLPSKV